ncbi:hypothetical protein RRG08_033221 [Elysia crispata]|uniref:Uncharacterized protein n=1 Tax=Elysia crispata TaxID=231223 RepID=A0AAE1ED54_9GAST|nr:hypothetical protein RRG08_033221 [Elysia crispata]
MELIPVLIALGFLGHYGAAVLVVSAECCPQAVRELGSSVNKNPPAHVAPHIMSSASKIETLSGARNS